jgi:hypothetical protein
MLSYTFNVLENTTDADESGICKKYAIDGASISHYLRRRD